MSAVLTVAAVLLASFVKGAIGFGFPTVATPVAALFVEVKTAVVLLILPNIVMDGIQLVRRGGARETARRLTLLIASGAAGTVAGTHLLVVLPSRTVTLILGCFVILFVALNATRFSPRLPGGARPWLSGPVGFVAGVLGGVTNAPAPPVVIYFYALRMGKDEFVRSVAFVFLVYKAVQLGAVSAYGLLTWRLLAASAGLTALGLVAFAVGLRAQDRLPQRAFNRAILVFLAGVGLWLVVRAAR